MYNYRSRLIHGDLFIPSTISKDFALEDIEKHNDDFYDLTEFAIVILTASFQELIQENKCLFYFKTVLN